MLVNKHGLYHFGASALKAKSYLASSLPGQAIHPATSIDHIHDLLRERGVAVPRWQLMAHLNHRLRKTIPETIQGFVVERVNSTISSRRQITGQGELQSR